MAAIQNARDQLLQSAGTRLTESAIAPGATRNVLRGEWVSPGELYRVGDVVLLGGYSWSALVNHISSALQAPPAYPTTSNAVWTLAAAKGEDAVDYSIEIQSTNGTIFRVGQAQQTTLVARIFRNGVDITDAIPASQFKWERVSMVPQPPPNDDATWNANYASGFKQILISVDDVQARATFHFQFIE